MLEEVKILFREYSDVLDEYVVETLWATTIDSDNGKYRIENVPFYVKTAFLNIVHAEFDQDEGFLVFKKKHHRIWKLDDSSCDVEFKNWN